MVKKFPWGVFAWIFAEITFFLTLGVAVAYVILNAIAGATSGGITLFTNWWQTLLFVADVLMAVACLFCIVKYTANEKKAKATLKSKKKK